MIREHPLHIIVIFAVSLTVCVVFCLSREWRQRFPAWSVFAAVVLMALLALGVATLGDAADTARHLLLFHTLTDVVLCFWAWAFVRLTTWNSSK